MYSTRLPGQGWTFKASQACGAQTRIPYLTQVDAVMRRSPIGSQIRTKHQLQQVGAWVAGLSFREAAKKRKQSGKGGNDGQRRRARDGFLGRHGQGQGWMR